MNDHCYAILTAGGVGCRVWAEEVESFEPNTPEASSQTKSLLQKGFERISKVVPSQNIFVLGSELYKNSIEEQLPELTKTRLILEPVQKKSAPSILLTCMKIFKNDPEARVLVEPVNQLITRDSEFVKDIQHAFDHLETEDSILTFGLQPLNANTTYGFIEFEETDGTIFSNVRRYTECGDAISETYLRDRKYLWNSGIFVWKVSNILQCFKTFLPELYLQLEKGRLCWNTPAEGEFINEHYHKVEDVSIGSGIMQQVTNLKVLRANFSREVL